MLLKLTSPMMHGPAVVRLQEKLALFHYLFLSDVDGIFGQKTDKAVRGFQAGKGLLVDGVVGARTWTALEDHAFTSPGPKPVSDDLAGLASQCPVVDLRGEHLVARLERSTPRLWTEGKNRVCGITLHQTGCLMSSTVSAWRALNAHVGFWRDGTVCIVNDLLDFIWHAQGLSPFTIGFEFSGNMAGVEGDSRTVWQGGGGPHPATEEQIRSGRAFIKWLVHEYAPRFGGKIEFIHAHRQSSKDRPSDPGERLWRDLGLWACDTLGLIDGGAAFTLGTGRPLPCVWGDRYTASF